MVRKERGGDFLYKQHIKNLVQIEQAIKLIQLDLRRYISTEQVKNEEIYTKIFSYLVTCWAEVRILKLAYEPNTFTDNEIKEIINASTLKDKWVKALNISVCKAYNITFSNDKQIITSRLNFTPKTRYLALINLIENDLMQSIEIRNRIAHGQWVYAFTNNLEKISTNLTKELKTENIVSLQLKIKLFKSLTQIIHDLAVSPPTFEKNFDMNFNMVEQQINNLHKRDYNKYKIKMVEKYKRGLNKRRNSKETA